MPFRRNFNTNILLYENFIYYTNWLAIVVLPFTDMKIFNRASAEFLRYYVFELYDYVFEFLHLYDFAEGCGRVLHFVNACNLGLCRRNKYYDFWSLLNTTERTSFEFLRRPNGRYEHRTTKNNGVADLLTVSRKNGKLSNFLFPQFAVTPKKPLSFHHTLPVFIQ